MKSFIKIFTIGILNMVMFFSCIDDFRFGDKALDKLPGTDMNIDSVFNKAELARRYLWSTYHFLYYPFAGNGDASGNTGMQGNNFETLSDCWHSVMDWDWQCRTWYSGTYNATIEWQSRFAFYRSGVWDGVRAGWTFIENIDRVPDMDQPEKDRLKAEAKIIIASRYFDLFRHYGGLPIVDRVYKATDDIVNERETVEKTVGFMVQLLNDAAAEPNLPWRISDEDMSTWFGRLTKGAAMGLKAKILIYAASPIFNAAEPYCIDPPQEAVEKLQVWYGGYKPELWDQVIKACEDFFSENTKNGNYYQLVQASSKDESGYRNAFRRAYWERANSEKIMSTIKHNRLYEWTDGQGHTNPTHQGAKGPTAEMMEMFPNADGTPFDTINVYVNKGPDLDEDPYLIPAGINPNPSNRYIFDNRDPRLYETLLVQKRGEQWQGKNVELWPGGNYWSWGSEFRTTYLANGMGLYKWILDFQDSNLGALKMQFPYLRMAEMHLIYAEALAETGDLREACNQVNLVRERVGLGKIEVCNPTLNLTSNKDNLIKEILRERACELAMEDVRFLDQVRRKLQDDFTRPLHSLWTYRKDGIKSPQGDTYPELWYEKRRITQYKRAWWDPGFWTNKWYLMSLPVDEVNKGWGLTQNPGW